MVRRSSTSISPRRALSCSSLGQLDDLVLQVVPPCNLRSDGLDAPYEVGVVERWLEPGNGGRAKHHQRSPQLAGCQVNVNAVRLVDRMYHLPFRLGRNARDLSVIVFDHRHAIDARAIANAGH